jgi:hypothetical protein
LVLPADCLPPGTGQEVELKTVTITLEALDSMQAQYTDLKRKYAHLATLFIRCNNQRTAAEEEVNRLLGLAQGSWLPLWEENEHLYRVLSEQEFCSECLDNVNEPC